MSLSNHPLKIIAVIKKDQPQMLIALVQLKVTVFMSKFLTAVGGIVSKILHLIISADYEDKIRYV